MSHHDAEVFISVNGGGYISVVLAKFVEGDDAIGDLGVPHAHELTVSFLGSLLASHNVWMLTNIVDASNIIESDLAIAVDVQLVVGLSNVTNTALAEVTSKGAQEFVEVNRAAVISIQVLYQYL